MKTTTVAVCAVMLLTGCAIKQQVRQAESLQGNQVCLIEQPRVKEGFKASVNRSLVALGYTVRELPSGSSITSCTIAMTYTANWRWDLATYMAYAEIRVYQDGRPSGEAIYDSTRGGGNMNKFIDADKKINELVTRLMPRR